MMSALVRSLAIVLLAGIGPAFAQDAGTAEPTRAASTVDTVVPGSLNPTPLPPLANPDAPNTPARELFARKLTPAPGPARAYGGYADGCMSGAVALPITGPAWQVMRLSRNRNWGNPELIAFLERLWREGQEGRLEWPPGRRHVAAARRPHDHAAMPAISWDWMPTSGSRPCPITCSHARSARWTER